MYVFVCVGWIKHVGSRVWFKPCGSRESLQTHSIGGQMYEQSRPRTCSFSHSIFAWPMSCIVLKLCHGCIHAAGDVQPLYSRRLAGCSFEHGSMCLYKGSPTPPRS